MMMIMRANKTRFECDIQRPTAFVKGHTNEYDKLLLRYKCVCEYMKTRHLQEAISLFYFFVSGVFSTKLFAYSQINYRKKKKYFF